jgi:5-methylcytosine-specific restriction endonuclease McrA
MAKLTILKNTARSPQPASRVTMLPTRPDTVERKRGSAGVKDRNHIRRRDYDLCQACRAVGRATIGRVVDHIIPLWNRGSDEDSNKQLLCVPCHDAKTKREAGERAKG